MSKTSYPAASDVTTLLSNLPSKITIPAGFDITSQVNAAIAEWQRRTGYTPFFQAGTTAVAIPYDPPGPNIAGVRRGGATKLLLHNGLLSLTSIYTGVTPSSTGVQLIQNQDFFLGPSDAPSKTLPYTKIEFSAPQWGPPQSISVTGLWGYCQTNIPDEAWLGILDLAASNVLREVAQGIYASPTSIKDGDFTVTQLADRDLGTAMRKGALRALGGFRLY